MRGRCPSCHDAVVVPYAAYLRVYQPLAAFPEPERSAWATYVAADDRPDRTAATNSEHTEALRRLIAVPPIVAPARESGEAYVRRAEGVTYVCPWQTRLRSWLRLDGFSDDLPPGLAEAFMPREVADQALREFEEWQRDQGATPRPFIQTSTWNVPMTWFVPFDAGERLLVLGDSGDADDDGDTETETEAEGGRDANGATTAATTRTLVYVTAMAQARRRVARALAVVRRHLGDDALVGEIEEIGRWLEEFHPHSLVELDYGGLVLLLDDEALRGDQSVAEVSAALTGLETGKSELALGMYKRVVTRWRAVQALESAN